MNLLGQSDPLTRFIIDKSKFSVENSRVKPRAFLPRRNTERPQPRFELSVFQIKGLSELEIWRIGEQHVSSPAKRDLRARGDLLVGDFDRAGLTVDPDNEPPRHATVVGWPEEKFRQQSVAQELAGKAQLKLPHCGHSIRI